MALRTKSGQGRIAKLSDEQRKKLPELLRGGAKPYGFPDGKWTYARVAEVIRREFGVTYTPEAAGRILVKQGWKRELRRLVAPKQPMAAGSRLG
jgi:transposase